MPLDPDIKQVLDAQAALGGPTPDAISVEELRRASETTAQTLSGDVQAVDATEDRELAGVPVRLYRPAGCHGGVLAWLHGGGWVTGSLDAFDPLCRALANASGCIVANVDYRLAPEHPFPAGLEDTLAVTRCLLDRAQEIGGDPRRVAVGGDSAGGNLVAVAMRRLRDGGEPLPAFQALVYPVTDGGCSTPSYRACEEGYGLSAASMHRYFRLYLGDDSASALDPDVSPLRAGSLAGLPPAIVLTAEFDPLRDEGEAYAAALREAGVAVELHRAEGTVHGFFRWMGVTAAARDAVARVGAAVREAVGGAPAS